MAELNMRKDVPLEETWDLTLLFRNREEYEEERAKARRKAEEIRAMKGTINTAEMINKAVDLYQEYYTSLSLVLNYSELASSVDYYDQKAQEDYGWDRMLLSELEGMTSFLKDEISANSEEVLKEAAEKSASNRTFISDILREKPHRLKEEGEEILSLLSPILETPYETYNMAKLADMTFPSFTVEGKTYPLGYSLFEDDYQYEKDTGIRRTAFKEFSSVIRKYENTTASLYNAQCRKEKILSSLKGFDSVFDYLLFPQKVTREMYDRQIDLIMDKLSPHMRRYARLKKKVLGLKEMTYPDLLVPLDSDYSPSVTWKECEDYALEGLSVLGEDYLATVREAFTNRWFDRARNQGKSTGGFCASPYRKGSFILLSWNGRMSDVFTAVHELGHAGHFKAASENQSILDNEVSSYFVEAPSTINELLLAHSLLKRSDDRRFKGWVLDNIINNTYYHNFVTHLLEAAYQREVYRIIDQGGSVQADTLKSIYKGVLEKFWGDDVVLTEGAELTWMRQPHYYMGLYSYTYSAGLTIATEVVKRIEREGEKAVEDWKSVLASGGTLTPLELAKKAGVDISTSAPLLDTIETIGGYITSLEEIFG
ncbi:MAG: oligoendopeptidase F [Candidatus Ornithospirochaeta sp.]|nr:oligoendopeptidase F [Sphaerochaetaceae bacterium]MDY5523583.1 oligoendopeptidase F [Candidatus Ornithospirochaeta sp.]